MNKIRSYRTVLLTGALVLLSNHSVEPALASARQKAATLATQVMRQQAAQQVRSKVSHAALRNMQVQLPVEAAKTSPLTAAVAVLNGTRARELQQGDKLTASFLRQPSPQEPVSFTTSEYNPGRYLNPEVAGELLALHRSGDLYEKVFFESPTFKKWAALYTGPEDARGFAAQVRKLVNRMEKEKDKNKVEQLLATVPYLVGDTPQDLEAFVKLSKLPMVNVRDLAVSGEYADAFLELTTAQNDMSFLRAEEASELSGRCGEKALWSALNLMLYNKETGLLDLAKLPADVHPSPKLVAFVNKYPNPTAKRYYSAAAKDFLQLVDGIPGVKYQGGKKYEIPGDRQETLKIINHLLFPDDGVTTFKELGDRLSTTNRIISFKEPAENKYGTMKVSVIDAKDEYKATGDWTFGSFHVGFVFDQPGRKQDLQIKKLAELDDKLGTPGGLVKLVPGYLHRLIDWKDGSVEQVKQLLEKVHATQDEIAGLSQGLREKKSNLLHAAIEQGRPDLVRYFLEEWKVDANALDSNADSPLVLAYIDKDTAIARLLVEHGADINQKDRYGRTLLYHAIESEDPDKVRLCLEVGADVKVGNNNGKTPMMAALLCQNKEIVDLLRAAGGNVNDHDEYGKTALHNATPSLDVIQFILEAGVDPLLRNKWGETALINLIQKGPKAQAAVHYLIGLGQDINDQIPDSGQTALHIAVASYSDEGAVKMCLELGADCTLKDKYGRSALMCALETGKMEKIRPFCSVDFNGSLVSTLFGLRDTDNQGKTALHYAAEGGSLEAVQLCLDAGIPIDAMDKRGNTPLFDALGGKKFDVAQRLLDLGANINQLDSSGNTPLWHSCFSRNKDAVDTIRFCLAAGADPILTGKYSSSPLSIAKKYGSPEMVQLLEEAIAARPSVATQATRSIQEPVVQQRPQLVVNPPAIRAQAVQPVPAARPAGYDQVATVLRNLMGRGATPSLVQDNRSVQEGMTIAGPDGNRVVVDPLLVETVAQDLGYNDLAASIRTAVRNETGTNPVEQQRVVPVVQSPATPVAMPTNITVPGAVVRQNQGRDIAAAHTGLQTRRERILNDAEMRQVLQEAERRGLTPRIVPVAPGQERAALSAAQASGIPFIALQEQGEQLPTGNYVQYNLGPNINTDVIGERNAPAIGNQAIRQTPALGYQPQRALEQNRNQQLEPAHLTLGERLALRARALYNRYLGE